MNSVLVASEKEANLIDVLLASSGWQITMTSSAQETLQHLKENTPSLMILDADLADLSGIDVCNRVKSISRFRNVPAILMIQARSATQRDHAQLSKADSVITKPLTGTNVRQIAEDLLNKAHLMAAGSSPNPASIRPSA